MTFVYAALALWLWCQCTERQRIVDKFVPTTISNFFIYEILITLIIARICQWIIFISITHYRREQGSICLEIIHLEDCTNNDNLLLIKTAFQGCDSWAFSSFGICTSSICSSFISKSTIASPFCNALLALALSFLASHADHRDAKTESVTRMPRWMMMSGKLMRPCSAWVKGRKPEIVTATANDFWLAIMTTDFKAGLASLRRRHGGNITMINKTCIARPHPRTAKMLATEIPLKAFCALAWLTFNHGIIVRRMIEITFSVSENLMTKRFTRETHLIAFPTNKGSSTVKTSFINRLIGSSFTFLKSTIQATRGGTVNTAAKLQITVSITDKATAPSAWPVCWQKDN